MSLLETPLLSVISWWLISVKLWTLQILYSARVCLMYPVCFPILSWSALGSTVYKNTRHRPGDDDALPAVVFTKSYHRQSHRRRIRHVEGREGGGEPSVTGWSGDDQMMDGIHKLWVLQDKGCGMYSNRNSGCTWKFQAHHILYLVNCAQVLSVFRMCKFVLAMYFVQTAGLHKGFLQHCATDPDTDTGTLISPISYCGVGLA